MLHGLRQNNYPANESALLYKEFDSLISELFFYERAKFTFTLLNVQYVLSHSNGLGGAGRVGGATSIQKGTGVLVVAFKGERKTVSIPLKVLNR